MPRTPGVLCYTLYSFNYALHDCLAYIMGENIHILRCTLHSLRWMNSAIIQSSLRCIMTASCHRVCQSQGWWYLAGMQCVWMEERKAEGPLLLVTGKETSWWWWLWWYTAETSSPMVMILAMLHTALTMGDNTMVLSIGDIRTFPTILVSVISRLPTQWHLCWVAKAWAKMTSLISKVFCHW